MEDRPSWDEGFHRIHKSASHVFQLKASGLLVKSKQPLSELLHRFESLSVAENAFHPFCTEKQTMDKMERSGIVLEVPKSKPVKGQKLYFDPLDTHLEMLKAEYKQHEAKKRYNRKVKDYKNALKTIPKVDYYPTTVLATMREKDSWQAGSSGDQMPMNKEPDYVGIYGDAGGSYGDGDDDDGEYVQIAQEETQGRQAYDQIPMKKEPDYVGIYGSSGDGYGDGDDDGEYVQIAQEEIQEGGQAYDQIPMKKEPEYVGTYGSSGDGYGDADDDGEYVQIAENQSDDTEPSFGQSANDLDAQYPNWRKTEYEIKSTLKKAQKGDLHVLYDTIIKQKAGEGSTRKGNSKQTKKVSG